MIVKTDLPVSLIATRYPGAENLKIIKFYQDEFDDIWPTFGSYEENISSWIDKVPVDVRNHVLSTLDKEYGGQNALHEAWLLEVSSKSTLENDKYVLRDRLILTFVDRWREFTKTFIYQKPVVVCFNNVNFSYIHSLNVQLLVFENNVYRHEFLFQNAVVIIESSELSVEIHDLPTI